MSTGTSKPSGDSINSLGYLIRASRKDANLSMQTVAEKAGLSVGFISQVERNITVPSLASIKAIAAVLNKRVSFFLEEPINTDVTTRANKRNNFQVAEGGIDYEILSTNFPGSKIQSMIMCHPPGYQGEPMCHEGEELIFILEGELTLELAGQSYFLKRGDSIHFDSWDIHRIMNHTTDETISLWCGTISIFGD